MTDMLKERLPSPQNSGHVTYNPCEMELRIPRIFLRIPKNLFLGILKNS